MTSSKVRIGVVGCGWYAQNHLHAWKALHSEGAELVGVADIDPSKSAAAGETFSVPAFENMLELVDSQAPDLVDIVTTVDSHRDLVVAAARRGIAVIVQKPLACDWGECLEIADAVEQSGIFFAVHENFRFQAAIARVGHLVQKGVVGDPTFARISFRTAFDTTAVQPHLLTQRRFILMDIGVHLLDLSRFLLGDVERLSCETQQRRPGLAGEDTATLVLRHVNGAVSIVDCSFSAHRILDAFPETMVDIEGDLGCIQLRENGWIEVKTQGLSWRENAAAPLLPWTERPLHVAQESVLTFNRHILKAWRTSVLPDTDLMSSLKTFALAEAAYAAGETHCSQPPASRHAQELLTHDRETGRHAQ